MYDNVYTCHFLQLEAEKQLLLRDKDTVMHEKNGLQQELIRIEHEKQNVMTEKSGNCLFISIIKTLNLQLSLERLLLCVHWCATSLFFKFICSLNFLNYLRVLFYFLNFCNSTQFNLKRMRCRSPLKVRFV